MPTSPVCTIDATGIHAPDFGTVLAYFQAAYRGIYGQDVVLDNATQDGQFLALIALALHEANGATVAAYNAFSPSTAQGVGLSSVVKTNGIARLVSSFSTTDLKLIGQAGESIIDGAARDANGVVWRLPGAVTFPLSGEITVTATAAEPGAVGAPAGTITTIATPTKGWQSVTNPQAATPGQPIEDDATLRRRQALSTALPAQSVMDGLIGAVAAIPGVAAVKGYENDTNLPDANGVPGHAIALVVDGGDQAAIANVIALKKPAGVAAYGDTILSVPNAYGIPRQIGFFRPKLVKTAYYLTVRAFAGYTKDVETTVQQALANYTNDLGVGAPLRITRAYLPANLFGATASATYEVLTMIAARDGLSAPRAATDIEPAFNERLICDPTSVSIAVLTS